MARSLAEHRVLLLLTTRPGLPEDEVTHFSRLQNFQRIALDRLGARDVIELLRDAFKSEVLARKLGGTIAYKSDGVPFFVHELIRGLKEGRLLTQQADGTYVQTHQISDIEVPSAVKDLIEGRLRELSKEERAILDVGAVQGFEFQPDLVARVLERKRVRVLQDLAEIERRSGVVRAAGLAYRFDQNQIHEIVLNNLSPALTQEYHSLLAECYAEKKRLGPDARGEDAFFLSWHHLHGVEPVEAIDFLDAALRHLEQASRTEMSIRLLDRALEVEGLLSDEKQIPLLMRKSRHLGVNGRVEEALVAGNKAVRLAEIQQDKSLRGNALLALGAVHFAASRYKESAACAREVLELAVETGDKQLEMQASRGLGASLSSEDDRQTARELNERSLALARELGDRAAEGRASLNLGYLELREGKTASRLELYRRSRELARETGNREGESLAVSNLASVALSLGRHEEARQLLEEGLAMTREIGYRSVEARLIAAQATAVRRSGEHEAAERLLRESAALYRELQAPESEASALAALAEHKHERGDSAEAVRLIDEALESVDDAPVSLLLFRARLDNTHIDAAREALDRVADSLDFLAEMEAHFGAWRAFGERSHLEKAHRMLQHLRQHAPEEDRDSMVEQVPLHREITAAAKEHLG